MKTEQKIIKTPEGQPDKIEVKAQVKSGKLKGRTVTVWYDADDAVRDQVHGFVDFLRGHAIVGLAVGFVAGAQAQAVVKQLIDSLISPTLKLLFGGVALEKRSFWLHIWGNSAEFKWGALVYVLLNLIIVLATIYAIIKLFNLDDFDKKA